MTCGYAACEIITSGILRAERAVRQQILGPKFSQRLFDHRQLVMAVERAFAQTGEMLATSQHSRGPQAGEELARVGNRLARIRRNRARTHDAARSFKRQIEHGSEVNVESQSAAVRSDDLPMLAEKFAIGSGEHLRCRRGWTQHLAKAVHVSAFEIDAGKQWRRNAFLTIAEQAPGLPGTLYIASEQNHPRRLQTREQGTEPRRHFRAVEADDQKLADSY